MAAPTFVSENETAWNTNAASRTMSPVVQAGDLIVVYGITADSSTTLSIAGGGLTWTTQKSSSIANNVSIYAWTATATSSTTVTITVTRAGNTNTAFWWGGNATVWRNHGGVGASVVASNTGGVASAYTAALTTTGANSAVVVAVGDWSATTGTGRVWATVNSITPTAANNLELTYDSNGIGSIYTPFAAYYSDAGAAGSKTVGLTTPTGSNWTAIAVEILAAAGTTDVMTLRAGSLGKGTAPTEVATANVAGALGKGTAAASQIATANVAGALGKGVAAAGEIASANAGGAVAKGFNPTDSSATTDVMTTAAGSLGRGTSPAAVALGTIGGSIAKGTAATEVVIASVGGSLGKGVVAGGISAIGTLAPSLGRGTSPSLAIVVAAARGALGKGVAIGANVPAIDLPVILALESRTTTEGVESRTTTFGVESRTTTIGLENRTTTMGIDG